MSVKILKEQVDSQCTSKFANNNNLLLFCNYKCFDTDEFKFTLAKLKDSKMYAVLQSKKNPKLYVGVSNDESNASKPGYPTLSANYYSDPDLNTEVQNPYTQKLEAFEFRCNNLNQTLLNLKKSEDYQKIFDFLKSKAGTDEILELEAGFNKDISGEYELVPLQQLRVYEKYAQSLGSLVYNIISQNPDIYFWQKNYAAEESKTNVQKIIHSYTANTYDITNKYETQGKQCVNLKERYPELFTQDYYMCKTSSSDKYPVAQQLNNDYNFAKKTEGVFGKKMKQVDGTGKTVREEQSSRFCQNFIKNYKSAYEKKLAIDQNILNNYKEDILIPCTQQHPTWFSSRFYKDFKNIDPFKTQYGNRDYSLESYLKRNMTYEIKNSIKKNLIMIKENKKRISNDENFDIGSTIRKNLILVNENKKRVINEETKIIRHRLNLIAENTKLETKKDVYRLTDKLIIEMLNLSKKGYSKKIINEQYVEMISSIFNSTPNYIMQIFKERFAEYIIGKIAPEYQDAFLSDFIKVSISTLQIKDITKLTDCDFLTKKLSTDLVETLIKKGGEKMGADNLFYDYVRKIIVDNLKQSDIGQKFQNFFKDFICLSLPNIKDKMAKTTDDIKKAAIDTVNKKTLPSGT